MQLHSWNCPAAKVLVGAACLCAALSPAEIEFEVPAPAAAIREVRITTSPYLIDVIKPRPILDTLIHVETSSSSAASVGMSSTAIFPSR